MNIRIVALAAVLASLAAVPSVHAQAARGHGIPDPVTTAELQRYADRLMLSGEQRAALQPFHDEYVESFRILREGEIDRFIEDVQKSGGMTPGRDAWEKAQRNRERIVSRIAALDDSLFAALEPILTDEQRNRLPRVRMARQRARVVPAARTMMMQVSAPDLSELVLEVGLNVSEFERIDPMLFAYEQKLTKLVEQLPDVANKSWERFHEGMEEMRSQMQRDPEAAVSQQEVMMEFMAETFLAPQAHMVEMRALGRKTLYELMPHISGASGRQLRNAFVQQGYGMTSHSLRSRAESMFEKVDAREDLDEARRKSANEIAEQTRSRIDSIVRKGLELTDDHECEHARMFSMGEGADEFNRRIAELRQEVQKVDEAAMNAMAALFPEEAPAAAGADGAPGAPGAHGIAGTAVVRSGGSAIVMAREGRRSWGGPEMPAPPISQVDLAEFAELLGIENDQRDLLDQLHESYMQSVEENVEERSPNLTIISSRDAENAEDAEQDVRKSIEKRWQSFEALVREDERFINDLAALFPERERSIERVRLLRERRRFIGAANSTRMMGGGFFGSRSSTSIDLAQLARRKDINVAAAPDADEILLGYERALTALLGEFHERSAASAEAEALSMVRMMAEADKSDGMAMRAGRSDEWQEQRKLQEQVNRVTSQIDDLHRETMDRLHGALPSHEAAELLREYRRLAYPSVYNDPGAMEQLLMRSLRMEDLSESQRNRLVEMLAEYRSEYHETTEQLREITERFERSRREMRAAIERGERANFDRTLGEQLETFRHERRELNARAQVNLKAVLDEQQLERLGPLPDIDQGQNRRRMGAPW